MTQHVRMIADHEDEAGHLVVKDYNAFPKSMWARSTQFWYCEGCAQNGHHGVSVARAWTGTRWTSWYLV